MAMDPRFVEEYTKCVVSQRGANLLINNYIKPKKRKIVGSSEKILWFPVAVVCRTVLWFVYLAFIVNKIIIMVFGSKKTRLVQTDVSKTSIMVAEQ